MVNYSFPDKGIVFIEVSTMHRSHFVFFIFLQGKLCISASVPKLLAWTVFPRFEKMLSFGCVYCMKMGLLKRVSPFLFDKKTVNF